MPGNVAWRPCREKVRFVKRLIDGGHDDGGIVIKIRFNQRTRNECARITTTR